MFLLINERSIHLKFHPRLKLGIIFLITVLIQSTQLFSQQDFKFTEYEVKAVYLERFTRLIEWPKESKVNDPSIPFVLGIIGENPFGNSIEKIYATQKIRKKEVKIILISQLSQIADCHLVFVCQSEEKNLERIVEFVKGKPILTISDCDGFAEKGIHINLFLLDDEIRFEINYESAKDSHLYLSYQILNYAKIVKTK